MQPPFLSLLRLADGSLLSSAGARRRLLLSTPAPRRASAGRRPLLTGAWSALRPSSEGVPWDDYLAVALLLFFGVKTILDANEPKARRLSRPR